jgi:hypothetical protein
LGSSKDTEKSKQCDHKKTKREEIKLNFSHKEKNTMDNQISLFALYPNFLQKNADSQI